MGNLRSQRLLLGMRVISTAGRQLTDIIADGRLSPASNSMVANGPRAGTTSRSKSQSERRRL